MATSGQIKRRWRFYRTPAGRRVIDEFIDGLSDFDAAAVAAALKEVRQRGLTAARHLRGDIYEVRAESGPPRSARHAEAHAEDTGSGLAQGGEAPDRGESS
jgi:hypothetical protein